MLPTLAAEETILRAFCGLRPDVVDDFAERGRLVLAGQLLELRNCLGALEFGVQPGDRDRLSELLRFLLRPRFRDPEYLEWRQFPDGDWVDAKFVSSR